MDLEKSFPPAIGQCWRVSFLGNIPGFMTSFNVEFQKLTIYQIGQPPFERDVLNLSHAALLYCNIQFFSPFWKCRPWPKKMEPASMR